jgi:limonene-1,2-epoxide hydrolase
VQTRTDTFIDALRRLEADGDTGPIAGLFTEDADVSNPLVRHDHEGARGAEAFWRSYRDAFSRIASSFRTVVEDERASLLEWVSEGETASGPVRYGGVSVLEWDGDRIAAFRTYFDTAAVRTAS